MDFDAVKAYVMANKRELLIGAVFGFVISRILK